MVQFTELPENWKEAQYETGPSRGNGPYMEELDAMWVSEDDHIRVSSRHSIDENGDVKYPIIIEQHVEENGLSTIIQTHARIGDDRQDAEKQAVDFMKQVNDGEHKLRVLAADVPDEMNFVQFYTISDSQLPGEITAEQLVDVIKDAGDGNEISGLPEEITRDVAEDEMVQIDVFPRHIEDVDGIEETE